MAAQGLLHPNVGRLCLGPYLRCTDLCVLMRVSHEWFSFWIDDRSWIAQRNRVCGRFPALQSLFKEHKPKPTKGKRRKTDLAIPGAGIWFVFRRYLSQCINIGAFKQMCRNPKLEPLIGSVLRMHVPYDERIREIEIVSGNKHSRRWSVMHIIYMWMHGDEDLHPGDRMEFRVLNGIPELRCSFYCIRSGLINSGDQLYNAPARVPFAEPAPWIFEPWSAFVLQRPCTPLWTPKFEKLMKGSG